MKEKIERLIEELKAVLPEDNYAFSLTLTKEPSIKADADTTQYFLMADNKTIEQAAYVTQGGIKHELYGH